VKRQIILAVLFLSWVLCISCGGGSSSSSGPYSTINSGNWSLTATSTVTSGLVLSIGGSLTQSANVVSGIMLVSSSASNCPSLSGTAIPFTGSFRGNTLTLKSANFSGQFVTLNAVGSGNSLTGTYSVAGGCADGDKGTIAAIFLPPLTGTWNGTFRNPDGTPIPINPGNSYFGYATATLTLTQSATAINGQFPLSGTFDTNLGYGFCSGTIPDGGISTAAYVMGTFVVIKSGSAGGGEIHFVGQLEETEFGPVIYGRIVSGTGSCGIPALLSLM